MFTILPSQFILGCFCSLIYFYRYSSSGKNRVPIKQDMRKRDDVQHNQLSISIYKGIWNVKTAAGQK